MVRTFRLLSPPSLNNALPRDVCRREGEHVREQMALAPQVWGHCAADRRAVRTCCHTRTYTLSPHWLSDESPSRQVHLRNIRRAQGPPTSGM